MTHLNDVEYLLGEESPLERPMRVFDDGACEFVSALSQAILKSGQSSAYPDLAYLAFWGRKANIKKMRAEFGDLAGFIGRGLCLHIAPGNVPVNFAFSWLFSLLAGNANIVRVPSRNFPQTDLFCDMAKRIIAGFPDLEKRNALVRYPRNNDITAHFSGQADARMIWGGDATISLLKSMPTKPRCVDLCFADRYSIAIFSGEAVQKAGAVELGRIIANFYNDIYMMDQNACSSPQIVVWKDDIPKARNRFWRELFQYAKTKYEMPEIAAMDKFTELCNEAVENKGASGVINYENLVVRVNVEQLTRMQTKYRGRYGLFHEYILKNWNEFFNFLTEKVQTIASYGIDAEELREKIIGYGSKGVDRIVNMGDTLKIGVKWDGFNIVRQLSRYIALE